MPDVTNSGLDPRLLRFALQEGLLSERPDGRPAREEHLRINLSLTFTLGEIDLFMAALRSDRDWSRRVLWADRGIPGAVVEPDRMVLARWRRDAPAIFERAEAEGYSRIDNATNQGIVFTRPADGSNLLVVRLDDGRIVVRGGTYSAPDPAAAGEREAEEERTGREALMQFMGTENRGFARFVVARIREGAHIEIGAGSGRISLVIDHDANRSYVITRGESTGYVVERALSDEERDRLTTIDEDVRALLDEFGFQPTILPVSADSVPGPANGALPAAGPPDNVVVLSEARTTAANGSGSEPPVAGSEPPLSASPEAAVRDNENVIVRVAQGLADSPRVEERARRVMRSLQEDPARATVLHWRIFARLLELEAVRDKVQSKLADGSYEALVQLARAMARRSHTYRGEPILIRIGGGSGTPPAGEAIVNSVALSVDSNVKPVTEGNLALTVIPATSEQYPLSLEGRGLGRGWLRDHPPPHPLPSREGELRTRLAQVAAQRGLAETAAAILRFSDAQLRTLLKHTASWREMVLHRGFSDIAASAELSSVTDRALALLAATARSRDDLRKIAGDASTDRVRGMPSGHLVVGSVTAIPSATTSGVAVLR